MVGKTFKKLAKVGKKVAARAGRCRRVQTRARRHRSRSPARIGSRPSSQVATLRLRKPTATAPVQAYIAAMPAAGNTTSGAASMRSSVRTVPDVRKAVKWNTPFYGIEGQGWFLGFHCFTKYVKVAFFRGTSLRPLPPVESKHEDVRYFDIHEDDQLDEELVASWIRQASELPGWVS